MKGFKYPFRIGDRGPEVAEDEELVASALTTLIGQQPGERPYQSQNGVNTLQFVFQNVERLVQGNVRRELMLAMLNYEPRAAPKEFPIRVKDRSDAAGEEPSKVIVVTVIWEYQGGTFSTTKPVDPGKSL